MPRMSGEEVVRAIRNIDSDVQIILQTGYSGEKPPREMLKLLDIQGYHDKSEGPDRLLLWVDVTLKAAGNLREIHRNERDLLESRGQLRQAFSAAYSRLRKRNANGSAANCTISWDSSSLP